MPLMYPSTMFVISVKNRMLMVETNRPHPIMANGNAISRITLMVRSERSW
jgi:hypothetical protein